MKQQFDLSLWLQDKSRKVVTRDGRPVRIICTDRKANSGNIVGLVGEDEGSIYVWNNNGKHIVSEDLDNDLVFADEEAALALDSLLDFIGSLPEEHVSEDKSEKELAESYLAVFDKKYPILPTLKGKQKADFKIFLNKCQQEFGLKEFGIHPTQSKLFEKLTLLWATWGAEHLEGLGKSNQDELNKEPASEDLKEEISKWRNHYISVLNNNLRIDLRDIEVTANHFAEWQKDRDYKMYAHVPLKEIHDAWRELKKNKPDIEKYPAVCFQKGADWIENQMKEILRTEYEKGRFDMREEMMKDAVIAWVNTYESVTNPYDNQVSFITNLSPSKFKNNETVKIIICKNE